jgi:hypothetical protein
MLFAAAICGIGWASASGEETDPRPAAGIQDNSCLVEEAYNQEPGVVQHITCTRRQGRDWSFNFTQEWPVGSQDHQFSYTIPYFWLRDEGRRSQGIGGFFLNYRYQALYETKTTPAFAPRVSLILPSGGSVAKDLGIDSFGYQVLLPFSKIVSDRVTIHANAGVTSFFDVQGHQPTSYLIGASGIYAVTRDFNLMLESLGEWNESVNSTGEVERERIFTISPGFRYAFNLPAGQLVVGAGLPVRLTKGSAPDYGVFFYLSFENSNEKK